MKLKEFNTLFYIATLYILTTAAILNTETDTPSKLSFLVSTTVFTLALLDHLKSKPSLPISSTLSFYFSFLIFAPLVQISTHAQNFVNTLPLTSEGIITSNLISSVFLSISTITYKSISKRAPNTPTPTPNKTIKHNPISQKNLLILTIACLAILALNTEIIQKISIHEALITLQAEENKITNVIRNKFILMIPFGLLCIALFSNSLKKTKTSLLALAVGATCVILLKNPFNENRNAIGPIYLTLSFIVMPFLFKTNTRSFSVLTTILILAFPLSSILTHPHIRNAFLNLELKPLDIFYQFNSIHYDAWANIYASTLLVKYEGLSFGTNLLSAILFFIPRLLWDDKLQHSGIILGDFLMANHSMWFNNLSFPFVSEFYFAFGAVGLVAGSITLSLVTIKIEKFKTTESAHIYAYLSFSLFFMLRGSLMAAFAFTTAGFLALYLTKKFATINHAKK